MTRLQMGSRADRWEHRVDKALELVPAQLVLMGLMFLRGPQTLNELLTRSNRLHDFDDTEQIQHQLERLISRGLALHLPRQAGQREDRYTHALGDPAEIEAIWLHGSRKVAHAAAAMCRKTVSKPRSPHRGAGGTPGRAGRLSRHGSGSGKLRQLLRSASSRSLGRWSTNTVRPSA